MGEHVVIDHDEATSSWMFVGVHSTALGPAMAGHGSPPTRLLRTPSTTSFD